MSGRNYYTIKYRNKHNQCNLSPFVAILPVEYTMKHFLLSKIRLTAYYPLFFIAFLVVIYVAPKLQLTGSQLTLFSVNSFLLAFYLGPIMGAQKQRLDDLVRGRRRSLSSVQHDLAQLQLAFELGLAQLFGFDGVGLQD